MKRAVLLLVLVACGGGSAASAPPPQTGMGGPPDLPNADAPPRPITSLRRAEVRNTIQHGVGYFLQNVTLEDWPVMENGKFHGFKLKTINSGWILDLKPGDVVTKVNGMPIENPDEADAALRSLEKAPSLRVDYERDGKAKKLELPIVD